MVCSLQNYFYHGWILLKYLKTKKNSEKADQNQKKTHHEKNLEFFITPLPLKENYYKDVFFTQYFLRRFAQKVS